MRVRALVVCVGPLFACIYMLLAQVRFYICLCGRGVFIYVALADVIWKPSGAHALALCNTCCYRRALMNHHARQKGGPEEYKVCSVFGGQLPPVVLCVSSRVYIYGCLESLRPPEWHWRVFSLMGLVVAVCLVADDGCCVLQ